MVGTTIKGVFLCLLLSMGGVELSYATSPQEAERFTHIAGFSLSDSFSFDDMARKLGKSQVKESGDAATGESQACYQTAHGEAVVEFFRGELDTGFTARKPKVGDTQCPKSDALTPDKIDIAGIRLGMSRASYEKLVGKPSSATATRVQHEFHYVQTLTDAELSAAVERARRNGYPPTKPESWRTWDVDIFLVADFTGDHLTSITVSRSAQN